MVVKQSLPTTPDVAPSVPETKSRWIEPADGWLAAGVLLCGTMVIGPFGAIPLIIGLVKLWRSVKAGTNVRPWAATVIGTFCMIDGMINFLPWSLDTFAHNTVLGRTFITRTPDIAQ